MTTWVSWLARRWTSLGPGVGVCAAAGLAAGAARLTAAPDPLAAWGVGLRVGAGAWIAWTLAITLLECLVPPESPPGGADWPARSWWTGARVLAGAAVLLAIALARSPARLAVNLLGFSLIGSALLWLVRRRAGGAAAARAALAVTLLALHPTHLVLTRPPERALALPGSTYRWPVGWPTDAWRLRYDVSLNAPLAAEVLELWVQHAEGAAQSPGRIAVSVNGTPMGALAPRGQDWFALNLPSRALAGQTHLRIELWQEVADRRQRLVAHRWASGASLGAAASSYFDGLEWRTGTFDDSTGAARPGAYVIELRGSDMWR